MINDERLVTFLTSMQPPLCDFLAQMEEQAKKDYVPIIRKETQAYLKVLLAMHKPRTILEVGTAIGFSACFMAWYNPVECQITTIENYEKRIPIARENFKKMETDSVITLLEGDAQSVLPTLKETYDFVFMDAAKGQYIHFWPEILRLTKSGSVIVTDNVLQDGDIIESHYIVARRNRTIHKRMREYLYEISHDKRFVTDILPIGDGLSVSVRK